MSDAEPRFSGRISVIGPMSNRGKPLQNTLRIRNAIEKILESLPDVSYTVGAPQDTYSDHIPTGVFEAIDLSDLVVVDISARSPCVMYELAYAHALGVPTLVV